MIAWQAQGIISLLLQCPWPRGWAGWSHTVKNVYSWDCLIRRSHGLVRSSGILSAHFIVSYICRLALGQWPSGVAGWWLAVGGFRLWVRMALCACVRGEGESGGDVAARSGSLRNFSERKFLEQFYKQFWNFAFRKKNLRTCYLWLCRGVFRTLSTSKKDNFFSAKSSILRHHSQDTSANLQSVS